MFRLDGILTTIAWNHTYIYFRDPIEALTGQAANKLGSFKLTDTQWTLAKEVVDVLAVRVSQQLRNSRTYLLGVDLRPADKAILQKRNPAGSRRKSHVRRH